MQEVSRLFDGQTSSFSIALDMGESFVRMLGAKGFEEARLGVELLSSKDGQCFSFDYPGSRFFELLKKAPLYKEIENTKEAKSKTVPTTTVPERSFIASEGVYANAQVVIPSNPAFSSLFSAGSGGASGSGNKE